ncbi:immunoglobulin domain-containing protein [Luteolibacter pohnpeiensis]|uniref:Immunoglobulin domain-containing protein n=1 Tax=Luteolibacter pohnpeiensis TaxID=454153 RepID=A0A934SC49_9BACT|nr:immunoglobulin domain-containing protein [Luteolibacter pohnpeiensis]MBK1882573.1 immunoglobulin domain-containing protein [Luteolibacter pohnpeiensis]
MKNLNFSKSGKSLIGLTIFLALPAALDAQTIENPSFEADAFSTAQGAISDNGNITGWVGSPTDRVGISSTSQTGTYADNGTIPDGNNVAFLKSGLDGVPTTLSTTITGLTPGETYKVTFRANASYGTFNNLPNLILSTDGETPSGDTNVGMLVSRVSDNAGDANPYHTIAYEFIATQSSHTLTLTNNKYSDGDTLLVDDFKIAVSSKAWAFRSWYGDADSGIQNNYEYTHAYTFNNHTSPIINNVQFTGLPEWNNPPNADIVGLIYRVGPIISNLEYPSGSIEIAETFRYDTDSNDNLSITLNGLEPNTKYVFSLYGMGWGAVGERASTFSSSVPGSDSLTVDLNQYGDLNGLIVDYTYTTDSVGSPVTITYLPTNKNVSGNIGNTFHTSGFSNRTAEPLVGAPVIVTNPQSATVAAGDSYTFSVLASGSDLTYEWKKGDSVIPDETSNTLTLDNITYDDAADYTVSVANDGGTTDSTVATLIVKDRVAGLFATGLDQSGSINLEGAPDPHYVFMANPDNPGSPIPTTVYSILSSNRPGSWTPNTSVARWVGPKANVYGAAGVNSNDAGEDAGVYVYRTQMDLTNFDLASVNLVGAWATDNQGLSIRVNGVDTGIVNDQDGSFINPAAFSIDSSNATFVNGINTIDFVVRNEEDNNVTTPSGWTGLFVTGLDAFGLLPDNTPPHITVQPGDLTLSDTGFTGKVYVGATGTGPLTYEWYHGETLLPDQGSSVLDISGYDETDAGEYHVVISNSAGTVESDTFTITIGNPPPFAGPLSIMTTQGAAVAIPFQAFTELCYDPLGEMVTITGSDTTSTSGGSIQYNESSGQITYTPPAGVINGTDTFTYTITDNGTPNASATGTVYVMIGNGETETDPEDTELGVPAFSYSTQSGSAMLSIQATANGTYVFQRSEDLVIWTDLETKIVSEGETETLEFTDSAPPANRAFYRITKQ